MDYQFTLPTLICAISKQEIERSVSGLLEKACPLLVAIVAGFVQGEITPMETHTFECRTEEAVRKLGLAVLQYCYSSLETEEIESMPGSLKHGDNSYRRLSTKSIHASILTRFGNIELTRATYRRGRSGKIIAPLEKSLGIERGFTPAAMDFVGQQVAATGASQSRAINVIAERTGTRIGAEKLRKITSFLADSMEVHRQACQLRQLQQWIDQANGNGKNTVLSISRDGVSIGIAPMGYFEMASVATLSVYSEGNCIGTVYMAASPQENQTTLSDKLTSLLKDVIRSHGDDLTRIVYVTDGGANETSYWKNVLSKFFVDGNRIRIDRTLDYYHASLRLTTIADCLKLTSKDRREWLESTRKLLLEEGGWGRMMRSISAMKSIHGLKRGKSKDFLTAEKYLRRYRRFMNYWEQRERLCPIGSGIVESACKQIVSERMKLSGMRWKYEGMQQIMTLRSILLSQTWASTFKQVLLSNSPVENQYVSAA